MSSAAASIPAKKYIRRGEVAAIAAHSAAAQMPEHVERPRKRPHTEECFADVASVAKTKSDEVADSFSSAPASSSVNVAPIAPVMPARRLLSTDAAPFRPPATTQAGIPSRASSVAALPVGSSPDASAYVAVYWKGLLHEWEDEVMASGSGASSDESATLAQSRLYLKPLLARLRARNVPPDMLKLLAELTRASEAREYAAAGDAYVRLAIGNARWPIGVTAVGIHDRAAREKVQEGKQAHVMHDEESRKFVTIIKRLMTFAQRKYPAEGSRSFRS